MAFAIKAGIGDPRAMTLSFAGQKTMYGGKAIAAGDRVFVFASENEGGPGLLAAAVVTSAEAVARTPGLVRQTPRVTVAVTCIAFAARPLGRSELKAFRDWHDGRPETELNFKLYRQATNKIVGLSDGTAAFLTTFFPQGARRPPPSSRGASVPPSSSTKRGDPQVPKENLDRHGG